MNDHEDSSVRNFKRCAKREKKALNLTHKEALDYVATQWGYRDFRHFRQESLKNESKGQTGSHDHDTL